MEEDLTKLLKKGAHELEIPLNEQDSTLFRDFARELIETNKVMNLTAITEPREIVVKHFLDSLSLLRYAGIGETDSIIDVGSGAGFPGIPLKIIKKGLTITFLDSLNKRLIFIAQTMDKLQIKNYECLHVRAEDAGADTAYREKYDIATARAVAELRILCEYGIPFVKEGGRFLAMKGPDVQQEIDDAKNAIELLGGKIEKVEIFKLPCCDLRRTVIIVRKVKKTPQKYPRNKSKITKSPL